MHRQKRGTPSRAKAVTVGVFISHRDLVMGGPSLFNSVR